MKPVSSKLLYGHICQLVMDISPTISCTITLFFVLFWSLFQAVYPTFTVVMWTKPVGDIIYKILIEG